MPLDSLCREQYLFIRDLALFFNKLVGFSAQVSAETGVVCWWYCVYMACMPILGVVF